MRRPGRPQPGVSDVVRLTTVKSVPHPDPHAHPTPRPPTSVPRPGWVKNEPFFNWNLKEKVTEDDGDQCGTDPTLLDLSGSDTRGHRKWRGDGRGRNIHEVKEVDSVDRESDNGLECLLPNQRHRSPTGSDLVNRDSVTSAESLFPTRVRRSRTGSDVVELDRSTSVEYLVIHTGYCGPSTSVPRPRPDPGCGPVRE